MREIVNVIFWIAWVAGTFWVLYDAHRIGVKKDRTGGIFAMGPWGWFFTCLLLQGIGPIIYLFRRRELKRQSRV